MNQNIKELVASVKKEQIATGIVPTTSAVPHTSLSGMLTGRADPMVKEAAEAQAISDNIAEDIGVGTLEISQKIEKVAAEMSEATTVDEIIKIANDSGNSDLLNLKTIANSMATIVIADIESREA